MVIKSKTKSIVIVIFRAEIHTHNIINIWSIYYKPTQIKSYNVTTLLQPYNLINNPNN